MSEYQYYEFRTLDRPLSASDQSRLRALSTRAEITATSFTNTYHYGDFRGDPASLVDEFFDAHVYVSNWGVHHFSVRVPLGLLDESVVARYVDGEFLTTRATGTHLVLVFDRYIEGEGGEWEEGEVWMPSLIGLRDELMRGDLRALYLAWLGPLAWFSKLDDEDRREPPVPPGLGDLSTSQEALAEFLGITPDLIEAAARASKGKAPVGPSPEAIEPWLRAQPHEEIAAKLARFLRDDDALALRAEMMTRFRRETANPARQAETDGSRTTGEIRSAAEAITRRRQAEEAAEEARKAEILSRKLAKERNTQLDNLAAREPQAWDEVERLIATNQPRRYDDAVTLLKDLRDLAKRSGREEHALSRIREIRDRYSRKRSFVERLDRQIVPG